MTLVLRLALIAVICAVSLHAEAVWPHEHSDLKPDPSVTFGRLENGFRYMILPCTNPAGRATLHLLVNAGSYQEDKDERGLAHFVEHMVFNGTRDFPGDETIETLQRLGLGFGPDVNADTSMLETRYHFENLPINDPAALSTSLKILRNFADSALFASQAVEKERKVILAEKRSRDGAMAYAWRRELEFLPPDSTHYTGEEISSIFSGTRIESRINPIGLEKTIASATPEQLRNFYNRWYRPEQMILAVVGDIDVAATEKLITETFASMHASTPKPKPPMLAKPMLFEHRAPHLFVNGEDLLPQVHLTITAAVARDAFDNSARRIAELPSRFVLRIIAQRLEKTLKIPANVETVSSHGIPGWHLPLLRLVTPAEHWREASLAMVTEIRRAQLHGFSADEIAQETKSFLRNLSDDERDATNRTSPELASALVHAAARDVVFTTATTDRQTLETALNAITPAACLEAARQLWPEKRSLLSIWGPIKNEKLAEFDKLKDAAWDAKLDPYDSGATKPFPYTQFGPAGVVTSKRHDEALDCWFIRFANGVRLNFKSTKFEIGQVKAAVHFGYGNLGLEQPRMGMAIGALVFGGLRELPFEDFGPTIKKMGGHIESFSFGWDTDSFRFIETIDDKNLPLGLQIITAFLTAPAFRESAEPMMRAFFEPQLVAREQTAADAADEALRRAIAVHHQAAQLPSVAESRQISFISYRDSITPQLLNSPLKVTLVGDISLDEAIALVARTLGALPTRPTNDMLAPRRNYTPSIKSYHETVRLKGNANVGSVALAWTMPNEAGQRDDGIATLLTSIINDRLRLTVRQDKGETYSPDVKVWTPNDLAPAPLTLRARIETQPKHVERVCKAMRKVIEQLVHDGVTPDELERARQPLIKSLETDRAKNDTWLTSLAEAQSKPQFLVGLTDYPNDCRTITREEINAFARTLLVNERCVEICVVPQ